MMNFQTSVELPVGLPSISHISPILLMGSCFAENMGTFLTEAKFQLDLNPFGILYNPLSISSALKEIITKKEYTEKDLFTYRGVWHSTMHHGSFSATIPEVTLQNINARLLQAHQTVPKLDWLMLTFGTAYVYEAKETGKVVANCHKLPEKNFIRRRLEIDEIVEDYTLLLDELISLNPQLKLSLIHI